MDDSTIRGLREIELWLAEVDKRRLGSLPETSKYFIINYLSTTSSSNTSINHRQALKLPLALHSPESGTFVSPGWEDLPRSLPSLGEEDEAAFLNVMLSELNKKFALQLDTCPNTDRTTQFATEDPGEERACVVLVRASHATRLIDHLESANLAVVDSTMPGFRITEQSIAELSADLAERVADLDPENTVVLIQLLDNSVFECLTEQGDKVLPKRGGDGKYHAPGNLKVIGKDSLRELFMKMQPIFKTVKNFSVVVLSPLPRYLWHRCCNDPSHIVNSEQTDFASDMGRGLKDLTTNLRNMIFMRKLRGVTVMNSVEALGIVPDEHGNILDIERVIALWEGDPVHPSPAAYRLLAGKIVEKIHGIFEKSTERQETQAPVKRKQDPREAWVSGSQPVAKRFETSHVGATRGMRGARWSRGFRGRMRSRGGRFHWKKTH
jgi:hypothetical protein